MDKDKLTAAAHSQDPGNGPGSWKIHVINVDCRKFKVLKDFLLFQSVKYMTSYTQILHKL